MKNKNVHKINNNIYITSDEEIKEGDWVYCRTENRVLISNVSYSKLDDRFKIILTTDFRLAPDVQKIDDEFLEWFVKNSSCESVEVDYDYIQVYPRSGRDAGGNERYEYICKIIIPEEEPKQYTSKELEGFEDFKKMINKPKLDTVGKEFYENADMTITVKRQETLEEAAERIAYDSKEEPKGFLSIGMFIKGAKWQAEKMYEIMNAYADDVMGGCNLRAEEWFEQFKKK